MPTTRTARCTYYGGRCKSERPSDAEGLAFFQDCSPGTLSDCCADCGYHEVAHERFSGRRNDIARPGIWPRGVTPHEFRAKVDGEEFDRYYCGCYGWD